MKINNLTEEQNDRLAELLNDLCSGYYWQSEGWTDDHANAFGEAETALEQFLNSVTSELARGGRRESNDYDTIS